MARTLAVVIKAEVGAYQRAMKRASESTDDFTRKMTHISRAGAAVSRLGDTMTRRVTLPIVAVGAAATKMALDFDKSFTTMQTLAGLAAGDVDALKESVLDLAGETGKSPRELAEALYFLRSSGLDGAAALDALEVSAKGSAAGLGPVVQVADAVSSAMLAYAKSGLTAAEATDVLVATAREGKVEPAELASQMGRLVPVASELGITFGDVGGAIAALSTKGNDAEQATTQLTQVMMKLLKPSKQAEQALEDVGLSTDMIRQMIREKGLLGTLEELKARLGDAGFVRFLEDSRAVQGGLALLGGDLDKTREIMDAVGGSAGATEEAFATWAKSMGAQNARAFADFQVALIRVGDVLAPLAADILSFASEVAKAFSGLPGGAQKAIVVFGLLLAAVGPVLSIGGRLIQTYAILATTLSKVVPASVAARFGGLSAALAGPAGVAAALTAVATGFALVLKAKNEAKVEDAALAFAELKDVSREAAAAVLDLNNAVVVSKTDFTAGASAAQEFADSGKFTEQALEDLDDRFSVVLDKAPALAQAFIDNAAAIDVPRDKLNEWRRELRNKIGDDAEAVVAQEEYNDVVAAAAGVTEEATSALQDYIDTLRGMFDPQFAMIDAMQSSAEAQQELRDSKKELDEALASGDVERITEAQERYDTAVGESRRSVLDLQVAANELKDSMEEQGLSADEVTRKFVKMATEQGFSTEEALIMAEAFGLATEKSDELGATDPNVEVSQTGSARVRGDLSDVQQAAINAGRQKPNVHVTTSGTDFVISQLNRIPRRINVRVNARMGQTVTGAIGGQTFHEGGIVPGPRGREVAAILQAGEHVTSLAEMDSMRTMPAGPFAGGGGTVINVNVDARGSLNPNSREIADLVTAGIRRAGELGMPITVRGRRIA